MASRQTRQLLDLLDGFEMTKSQHDWLERRFENMTVKESLLFRGAMQIEQPRICLLYTSVPGADPAKYEEDYRPQMGGMTLE